MLFLHLDPVLDKLNCVCPGLFLLNQSVDNNAPYGDPEFVEPVDESRNNGDGEALRQGNKEEGGERLILQEICRFGHPVLEGKQVIQERDYWGCVLLDRLAWEVFDQPTPDKLSPCPFHVLSAILGLPLPGGAR